MYSSMAWPASGIQLDGAALVTFLVQADGSVAVFEVEVLDFQAAAVADSDAGIDEQFLEWRGHGSRAPIRRTAGSSVCRARITESALVSSRASADSREINCAWAGLGTVSAAQFGRGAAR